MIAPLARLIDRAVIGLAASRMANPDGRELHIEEAHNLLQRPDFFEIEAKPVELQFSDAMHFRFDSVRPGAFSVNNIVHGRLFRCAGNWQASPAAILLHGWNDVLNHSFRFSGWGRKLNRAGMNAVAIQLPYHFARRPRELGAWGDFLCPDILRTVEAIAQSLADIRSVVDWLLAQHCPAVGVSGISLGGFLAGLTACHDSRIEAAVLTVPVARMDRVIQDVAFCRPIREALQGREVDMEKLKLTANVPKIANDKILLIEAEYDQFIARETVEELWRAWDQPEIWRYREGHISVLGARGLRHRTVQWLAAKLGARAAK